MSPTLSEGIVNLIDGIHGDKFKIFLERHSNIRYWLFSADFCLDSKFPNRTIAVTVIPVVKPVGEIAIDIRRCIPRDIKNVKTPSLKAIELINEPNYFHFAFTTNDPVKIITEGHKNPREQILNTISELYEAIHNSNASVNLLRPFKLLRESSKAKGYNLTRHCNMMIFSAIVTALIVYTSKHVDIKRAGVFPDRDILTDLHDGIYIDLIRSGIIGHFHIHNLGTIPFDLGRGLPNATGKYMWYDELIRLPDYIASFASKWDTKTLPSLSEKSSPIFYDAFVDSNNIALFNLHHDQQLHINSITASKSPTIN